MPYNAMRRLFTPDFNPPDQPSMEMPQMPQQQGGQQNPFRKRFLQGMQQGAQPTPPTPELPGQKMSLPANPGAGEGAPFQQNFLGKMGDKIGGGFENAGAGIGKIAGSL